MGFSILKPSTWGAQTPSSEGKAVNASRWQVNNPSPKRVDARKNVPGHTCFLDSSRVFEIDEGVDAGIYYPCSGHMRGLSKGDEVIIPFGNGPAVCRVVDLKYLSHDQYVGTVEGLGYLKDVPPRDVSWGWQGPAILDGKDIVIDA